MKELRCLAFSEQEVAVAVVERRRRLREPMPEGSVQRLTYQSEEEGVSVTIHSTGPNGQSGALRLGETEVAAALVNFCMSRKIPMPVDSDKYLQVIKEGLTLMITMRFNRLHKKGSDTPAEPAEESGRLSRIVRPPR